MLQKFVRIIGGDPNKRQIEKYAETVEIINGLEKTFEALSDEALRAKTFEYRRRLTEGEALNELLPEAFATVREASKRTLGQRHFDVQLIGGMALHQGKIAEMRTGEGKTLVATLPLYLNALALNPQWLDVAARKWGNDTNRWIYEPVEGLPVSRGVHLVTVNDYLARRDARWMGAIYDLLGLGVGVLQMAARTENGKKAFLVDFERASPHEDQHNLKMVLRREAYAADITYGTNSEFGFDYLRDNMVMRLEDRVQRGHYYAIIDEVDNVLIDEARTPLIISGPAQDDAEWYIRMTQVIRQLKPEEVEISERDRTVTLTEVGETHVEELLNMPLRDPDRPEDVTQEQARLIGYLEQAMRAQHLFKRNKDYLVQGGKVIIIDEFTGRLMPGRRWSDGLHQAIEAKEGVRVEPENVTYATITIQNYFRMYEKLAGMSGTAITEAEEFDKIYKLDVVAIPTNLEYQASRAETDLIVAEDRDSQGYRYEYYTTRTDAARQPLFWKRKDYPDVVYRTEESKLRAIVQEIIRYNAQGRPILVGTTSVELSERLSNRLRAEPARRLSQALLLRNIWMEQHKRAEDGRMIEELEYLNLPLDRWDKAQESEARKMARELGISFNPEAPENLERLLTILNLSDDEKGRLLASLQAGIAHQVLNARKHAEESQIIAGAGEFGAVTIATNMAGRGVDIKLGGELAEEITAAVSRVLRRAGYSDPYDMSLEERRQALLGLNPADYGIYEAEIKFFLQSIENMERVKELGGLHVIGSERHEARRIDNQLRGRSARQGDPGSSRFYLSMEDELMRLFGGQQAEGLMKRLKWDAATPLEVGLVGRIVEQAQTRVEGANFDVRKHLLEYDDVLNTQRAKIYGQRNRIFMKEDLSEDVTEMLQTEVRRRIPEALKDEEGPWKLLAWLEQIQPPLPMNGSFYPSYTLRLLVDHILERLSGAGERRPAVRPEAKGDLKATNQLAQPVITDRRSLIAALLEVASQSLRAEQEHVLHSTTKLLELTRSRFEGQLAERLEVVDAFFDGLDGEDEEAEARTPNQLIEEISNLVHLPVKLSRDEQQMLVKRNGNKRVRQQIAQSVRTQVEGALVSQSVARLIGAVERRLEEELAVNQAQLPTDDWEALTDLILAAIQTEFEKRHERLVGENRDGQIAHDLETALDKAEGPLSEGNLLGILVQMPQGAVATFDRRTHRRVWRQTNRLTYFYFGTRLLENRDPDEVAEAVLAHLEGAQAAIRRAWGRSEWGRLAAAHPVDLDQTTQTGLNRLLGEARFTEIMDQPLHDLAGEERDQVIDELGRQALTEIYRQLIVGVISELWVEYLTSMEALRVSIGLEAYAQRDPLVQYKNRAFEMFQELLSNMRLGVVTRMFTFRPRDLSSVQTTVTVKAGEPPDRSEPLSAKVSESPPTRAGIEKEALSSRHKRRRRRR